MKRIMVNIVLSLVAALLLAGCGDSGDATRGSGSSSSKPGEPPKSAPGDKVLNLYIWTEYMPDSVLEKFTEKTGIKVNVDNYDSNETLLAKLQSGVANYDVCVPSDYMVKVLIDEKLLREIDHAQVANIKHVDPRFLKKRFDPENRFSVPYFFGTTGIGYDKSKFKEPVTSWAVMFDAKYSGKILMLDDMRECFAAALKLQGKSLNTTSPEDLRAAAELLKKQKPLVKTYDSNEYDNMLASGEVVLSHGYNGQFAKLAAKAPDRWGYAIPREGATQWMDALCVPAKAPHPAAAAAFINFVHDPRIAAEIVNGINYASTNAAAREFVKPEILGNPAIYAPDDQLANCEAMEDIGEAREAMDKQWTEIKAQ